jgi:hypothetical protein
MLRSHGPNAVPTLRACSKVSPWAGLRTFGTRCGWRAAISREVGSVPGRCSRIAQRVSR